MRYRWVLTVDQTGAADLLVSRLGIPPLLARILANRGHSSPDEAARFLRPELRNLSDPFALPGLQKAVERLWASWKNREKVLIYGDYDVDGVTATVILIEVLTALGFDVEFFLPHRLEDGYGLTHEAAQKCLQSTSSRLWITVDCGTTSYETISWLKHQGVEVIVVDHHQAEQAPGEALALINPHLHTDDPNTLPWGHLCSAGLAFKVAHGLLKKGRQLGIKEAFEYDLRDLLDLVALGTVADLAPLTQENRIFVARGIQMLSHAKRVGIRALASVASLPQQLGTYEIGFMLAPRLNAAGRLEDAKKALRLLLESDPTEADHLARQLDAMNRERQELERQVAEEAMARVRESFNPYRDFVIVEGHSDWHIGVVGIVASRVLQAYYRPTIILGGDNGLWRGSGRSIEGFDLATALRRCSDLLIKHGGHAMAAGLTIEPKNIVPFKTRLNELAAQALGTELLLPPLHIDTEATLSELSVETVAALSLLEPTGQANPPAQVLIRGLRLAKPPLKIGRNQQHLRLVVTDGAACCDAIWWNGAQCDAPSTKFDLVCIPELNDFNGIPTVRLRWIDWRPTH